MFCIKRVDDTDSSELRGQYNAAKAEAIAAPVRYETVRYIETYIEEGRAPVVVEGRVTRPVVQVDVGG